MSQQPATTRPTATYRLQLRPEFPFPAAAAAVPYLASLGVSHLHLSPVLEAVPGSSHGYDVVDHTRVREELGGEEGLRALARTARAHGLGLVLDIVPNHMAVPAPLHLNRPLWEVLREGPGSPYARWFDIEWEVNGGQLLLPVLGEPLDPAAVRVKDGLLCVGDHRFPLRAGTEALDPVALLAAQWYRPAYWREARTELNYRRFFTISDLIGVRVEDPDVFAATHAKLLELVADGVAEGLRIDHVDGLADPAQYLRRLRAAVGAGVWIVVEKILAHGEVLPDDWPVAGTTGYDALRRVDGVLVSGSGAAELAARYRRATGLPDWPGTAAGATREVLTGDLAAELATLVRRAGPGLAEAVRELLIACPVYRTYPGRADLPGLADPPPSAAAPDAVAAVRELLVRDPGFAARFAQTSAALRAKSLEDRAFYRYAPLLSATEVGGDPGRPAVLPEEFHAYCAHLERHWPASGTVRSTHDTKRSADVRARIAVLSQRPELMPLLSGAPDPQQAWVAFQSALGFGEAPQRSERLAEALLKAAKEAALHTSWTDPDPAYEATLAAHLPAAEALPDVSGAAAQGILAMTALHLTMPGVPEVYQGEEGEYRALVDPDNRRPAAFPGPAQSGTGAAKRELTTTLLRLRRDRPELFTGYAPLTAEGPAAEHCLAYTRSPELLVAVTRLPHLLGVAGGWRDTLLPLPPGGWTSALAPGAAPLTGRVPLTDLLSATPVAVLIRTEARQEEARG
ncbi:malto-oligosyltrehalose synthase [Streptomyces sp. NPDC002138]|uniref:malto-oligosyltrehalose synthase n=1 Tax=Streptomyces sp. NPDC002138 TaxID=3154410 RepID=UPI0033226829